MRRVSAATWKRLERLEQVKKKRKFIGGWPDIIYDCDEWSALAEPQQQKLIQDTFGREVPEPTPRQAAPAFDPEQYRAVSVELPSLSAPH